VSATPSSRRAIPLSKREPKLDLEPALSEIAQRASAREAQSERRFPDDAFAVLRASGALGFNAIPGAERPRAEMELDLVRRVAAADGSVGRIFDGHLNAVERLAVQGPPSLRDRELSAAAAGALLCGVWGGDPVPGEGPPAAVVPAGDGEVLRGVKTFCSGAGGLDRALVLARPAPMDTGAQPPPRALPVSVWVDLTDSRRGEVDETWYRSHGLIASVSHRVVFHDAPVLARLGEPGAIAAQPWFGRDALRTAASWAGMADTAVAGALESLAERPETGQLEALAAGRIVNAQRTIDVWLTAAAEAMDHAGPRLADVALHARVGIADACRRLLDEASRACGSRPFARAEALDRARRDLELFLLQHRLDPFLARTGGVVLDDLRRERT
jgi:alkylation response protein AidB-like acyl-CoA dehydrogenase